MFSIFGSDNLHLRFLDRGVKMDVCEESNGQMTEKVYLVRFYGLYTDLAFYAESEELYHDFANLNESAHLRITFFRGANMYSFTGKARSVSVEGNSYLTVIEQTSTIEESSRRKYFRDEMEVPVRLYGLHESDTKKAWSNADTLTEEFFSETLDMSAGGMCLVTNRPLVSDYEPYFLAAFVLNKRDAFFLPCKLLRKGDCPQTYLYKYDYGFIFLLDDIPNEKKRLTTSLFNEKLSIFNG